MFATIVNIWRIDNVINGRSLRPNDAMIANGDEVYPLKRSSTDTTKRDILNRFVASVELFFFHWYQFGAITGPILGLRPTNERRRYKVTPSLIGWAQT